MPIAYVLVNTEPEKMEEVSKEIKKIKGVVESSMVYGVYDIVAKIQTETMDRLKEIVASQIRRMESVRSSATMIVIEGP
jgi:DNA-binding Lrp family transcriptional regulator